MAWLSGWVLLGILSCQPTYSPAQMKAIEAFGPDPGELNFYVHVPEGLNGNVPLVVAMHGCLQNAETYAKETGWNDLADRYGFIVMYPEQHAANNGQNCFNWFEDADINRDQGEAMSIRSMVDYVYEHYPVDASRTYATGLSAGGCMTVVMLAAYPEVFRAGAIMAGLPYKASTSLAGALPAMQGQVDQTPDEWGALVAEQNPDYAGEYPHIVIFHGAEDAVVSKQNMQELVDQWTHLHGTNGQQPEETPVFDNHPNVLRRIYRNDRQQAVVMTYEVAKMGHALAVDPGEGPKQGGATGPFAVDVDFFYTYWAARFFQLVEE